MRTKGFSSVALHSGAPLEDVAAKRYMQGAKESEYLARLKDTNYLNPRAS